LRIKGEISGYKQSTSWALQSCPLATTCSQAGCAQTAQWAISAGASVPNPEYPKLYAEAKKSFDHNFATYTADYKLYVKQLKKGEEPHEYEPPQFVFDVPEKK
jgi:hypothetical protein